MWATSQHNLLRVAFFLPGRLLHFIYSGHFVFVQRPKRSMSVLEFTV